MKKTLLFVVLVSMVGMLLAAPSWYQNPGRLHDPNVNWIAYGQGNSYDVATTAAKADLVSKINTTITGVTNVAHIPATSLGREWYTSQITTSIRGTIERHISRAVVGERAQEGNTFYVSLSLNRDGLLISLEPELKKLWEDIQALHQAGEREFKQNGQIVAAFDKYAQLQSKLTELYIGIQIFNSVSRLPFNARGLYTALDMENWIKEIINAINLEVVSGDMQSVRPGSAFAEPILFEAYINHNGVRTPIANLPVQLLFGQTEAEGTTGANGQAQYLPTATANLISDGKIVLYIDHSQFPSFYADLFRNKKVEASYFIADMTQPLVTPPVPAVTPSSSAVAGEWRVGGVGPAGGLIFYDKGDNLGGWRYLEAAPENTEARLVFWVPPFDNRADTHTLEQTKSREVGNGQRHTQLLMNMWNQNGGGFNTAIRYVSELNVNGYNDWFLPTLDELNWMYGNLYRRSLGGLKGDWYWSSTTNSWYSRAFARNFANTDEEELSFYNQRERYVRAVRRF